MVYKIYLGLNFTLLSMVCYYVFKCVCVSGMILINSKSFGSFLFPNVDLPKALRSSAHNRLILCMRIPQCVAKSASSGLGGVLFQKI